jgi:glycosyltransferase involved in cell wall biosynthesis
MGGHPRIVYVTNNVLPSPSPGLSFSIENARGFMQAGAEFEVILRRGTAEDPRVTLHRLFGVDAEFNVCASRIPRLGGSNLPFYLYAFQRLLRRAPDAVIFRNANFLPWAVRLKRLTGAKVFFEAHDFWFSPERRGEPVPPGRRRYVAWERNWLSLTDGVLCTSAPQADLYRACLPGFRVILAVTGCSPVSNIRRQRFLYTLGYIGSLTAGKYPLEVVIEAMARSAELPQLRLLCIGATVARDRGALLDAAERHGVRDRVEISGWVTGADLDRLRARMDVGIAVLTDSFWNRTATPLKVLDYLSSGVPFVATRLDGIAAIAEDGTHGFLVENTPAAWGAALEAMYDDFGVYQQMAENCRRRAEELSWKARARHILQAIESVSRDNRAAEEPRRCDRR